jgi:RNA-directed DNA polymerase
MPGVALVNTGDPELEYAFYEAERRVLGIQAKLHRWARDDPHRRFDDLYNLVCDPAFLLVAWVRVRSNKGARSAGVHGRSAWYIEATGVEGFLERLRSALKDRSFGPLPVRERMIPKADGKKRRLGIATITDRVVQASLKLVLEPVFEADFLPCSYGFRPGRRTHDAVAEVHHFTSRTYEWVVEGDIKACFDEISHCALSRHRSRWQPSDTGHQDRAPSGQGKRPRMHLMRRGSSPAEYRLRLLPTLMSDPATVRGPAITSADTSCCAPLPHGQ